MVSQADMEKITSNDPQVVNNPNPKEVLNKEDLQSSSLSNIENKELQRKFAQVMPEYGQSTKDDSTTSKVHPYTIFQSLLTDLHEICNNLNDEELKNSEIPKAIKEFHNVATKFSSHWFRFMECLRDILAGIGKFLSYPLAIFGIFSAAYNGCCKMRNADIDRTIRAPLFNVTLNLVSQIFQKKSQQNELNDKTKLEYLALLSSIDRRRTRELLKFSEILSSDSKLKSLDLKPLRDYLIAIHSEGDSGTNENITSSPGRNAEFSKYSEMSEDTGEPVDNKNDDYASKRDTNYSYEYENFIKNLYEKVHLGSNLKNTEQLNNNEEFSLAQKVYSNLMLGRILNEVEEVREIISIDDSPYKIFKREDLFCELAQRTAAAFDPISDKFESTYNELTPIHDKFAKIYKKGERRIFFPREEFFGNKLPANFKHNDREYPTIKPGVSHGYGYYNSDDDTLHAAIQQDNHETSLDEAEKLGLVTPERANELRNNGVKNIQFLYIIFRPCCDLLDTVSATGNVVNKLPKTVERACKFTEAVIGKVNEENGKNNGNNGERVPIIPVTLGFSMGGMNAQAAAVKNGISSVTFNSLGLGKGVRSYVEKDKITQANDDLHARCHQNYTMQKDWVSDPEDNLVAKFFTYKPLVGQTYKLELNPATKITKGDTRPNQNSEMSKLQEYANTMGASSRHIYFFQFLESWADIQIRNRLDS